MIDPIRLYNLRNRVRRAVLAQYRAAGMTLSDIQRTALPDHWVAYHLRDERLSDSDYEAVVNSIRAWARGLLTRHWSPVYD